MQGLRASRRGLSTSQQGLRVSSRGLSVRSVVHLSVFEYLFLFALYLLDVRKTLIPIATFDGIRDEKDERGENS